MDARDTELGEWLVTATAACALAACVAGILRPAATLAVASTATEDPIRRVSWVQLPSPSGAATNGQAAAPGETEAPALPGLPAALPSLGSVADLAELPALPTLPVPSSAPGPATPGTPSATGEGPVRLARGQLGANQPWPEYPREALRRGESGTVTVRLSVAPSGVVTSARVAVSSGWRSLDEAAGDTIRRRWSFPPGAPRDYLVDIRFQLL